MAPPLVSISVETTFTRMLEFHLANPSKSRTEVPHMPAPPPEVVDEAGNFLSRVGEDAVVLSGTALTPLPTANENGIQSYGAVAAAATPEPLVSFQGVLDEGGVIPPDTDGAVGPEHVVEILNTGFTVFNRAGNVVVPQISLHAFWSALGTAAGSPASRPFDPKILFDQYVNRWVVVSDSNPNGSDGTSVSWVLIGVSQSSDPTGAWNLFAVRPLLIQPPDIIHFSDWPDYPGLGLDPNNVIVTNNMFTLAAAPQFLHSDIWVFDKARLVAGGGSLIEGQDFARFHFTGFTLQPCQTFGQTPETAVNYFLNQGFIDSATRIRRFFRLRRIDGVGAAATLETFGGNSWLEVSCYNFCNAGALQALCDTPIHAGDTRLLNAVWRNGKIWATHTVGADCFNAQACGSVTPFTQNQVAWYEIDPASIGEFPGGVPVQQGHISNVQGDYFYPSVAVNGDECVAIGFSGSGPLQSVYAAYAVRAASDLLGTMRPPFIYQFGQGPYLDLDNSGRNRWGDYSATIVDPTDDATFWTVQEYAETQFEPADPNGCEPEQGRWGTHWAAFGCGGVAGDCNNDKFVNLTDYARLAICLSPSGGPNTSIGDECRCINMDDDGDVDLRDAARFDEGFTR